MAAMEKLVDLEELVDLTAAEELVDLTAVEELVDLTVAVAVTLEVGTVERKRFWSGFSTK